MRAVVFICRRDPNKMRGRIKSWNITTVKLFICKYFTSLLWPVIGSVHFKGWLSVLSSSETQGQSVGPGEKARRKFSSTGGKAPGYRLSPDHFQTVKRMLAPDWAQKMLCIIVPNRRTVSPEFFSWVHTRLLLSRHSCPVRSPSFPNLKRRNYRWVKKRFGCYQQEQFNLHCENSVSDGSQRIVNNIKFKMRRREKVQNAIAWQGKKTTLHVHHAFLYISLPSLHGYHVKMPNFTFCEGRKQAMTKLYFSLIYELGYGW